MLVLKSDTVNYPSKHDMCSHGLYDPWEYIIDTMFLGKMIESAQRVSSIGEGYHEGLIVL